MNTPARAVFVRRSRPKGSSEFWSEETRLCSQRSIIAGAVGSVRLDAKAADEACECASRRLRVVVHVEEPLLVSRVTVDVEEIGCNGYIRIFSLEQRERLSNVLRLRVEAHLRTRPAPFGGPQGHRPTGSHEQIVNSYDVVEVVLPSDMNFRRLA